LNTLLGGGNMSEVLVKASPAIRLTLTKSATAFTQVNVANFGLLVPLSPDGSNVYYRPNRDSGNAITNQDYLPARGGMCPLPGSGAWWVNVQTNVSAGTYNMLLIDFPDLSAMLAMMQALQVVNAASRLMSAPTSATVTGSTSAIIASNANRNFLAITHTGTTDGSTATTSTLDIAFGTSAVINTGIRVFPKQTVILDTTGGVSLQALNGISSSGNILVGVQEGV
jgi:hypothetical protein